MPTRDDLLRQINKLITIVTDLTKEVSRYIRVDNDLAQRYSRSMEELDTIRLFYEELRELVKELIIESSRHADSLNNRMDRLERYTILVRMVGSSQETLQIEGDVSRKHIEQALTKELAKQQDIVKRYQGNILIVQEQIARYGETVARLNELEEYQTKLDKALEAMARIREQLN